jgi:hypothetical protein
MLIVWIGNVNDAEISFVRRFPTERACEAAADISRAKMRKGARFEHLCLPTK